MAQNFQGGRAMSKKVVWVFLVLIIQHAKHMFRILLSSLAYLTLQFIFTLSQSRQELVKKVLEHKIRV